MSVGVLGEKYGTTDFRREFSIVGYVPNAIRPFVDDYIEARRSCDGASGSDVTEAQSELRGCFQRLIGKLNEAGISYREPSDF